MLQLLFALINDFENTLELIDVIYHGEHEACVAMVRSPEYRTDLSLQYVGMCENETNSAQSKERVCLFIVVEIVRLLVSADVNDSDGCLEWLNALYDRSVYGLLRIFIR